MFGRLDGITRPKIEKNKPGTRSGVFRDALYTYGKRAGTVKVLPGIRGTGVGNFFQNSRRKVYPIARGIGNIQALKSGNLVAQVVGRIGRIGSGAISGRLIDQAVRPIGLSPFFARQARVQLGRQLSKQNKFDKAFSDVVETVVQGKVKINQRAANRAVKRAIEVQKDAQALLNMINTNLHAYAPDVSSGQYLLGVKDGLKKHSGLLNESAMLNQDKFEKMGIKNYQGGAKYVYRDIFGFEKPGEARSFLLSSINKNNVFRAKQGENFFFYGDIDVGGSPLFPWIHAVEYGGKLPYYRRKGRKRSGYDDQFYDGTKQKDKLGKIKNMSGFDKNTYVPDFQYVPPTMFIYRSAKDGLDMFKKLATFNYLGDIDQGSTRYYSQWQAIAKKKGGVNDFYANETSYTSVTNTKRIVEELYQLDKASSRKASFWSSMEQKIPGPRIESAHGGFYSSELQQALGLRYVPEEMKFSITIPDIKQDGGEPYSDKFLGNLAKVYVTTGGSKKNIISALQKEIANNPSAGNYLRASGMRTIKSEAGLPRFRKITGKRGLKVGDSVFIATARAQSEAERVYAYFQNIEYASGGKGASPRRASKFFKKTFDVSTRRTGNKVVVYSKRKGRTAGGKQRQNNTNKFDGLSKQYLSEIELDEVYRRTGGPDL